MKVTLKRLRVLVEQFSSDFVTKSTMFRFKESKEFDYLFGK